MAPPSFDPTRGPVFPFSIEDLVHEERMEVLAQNRERRYRCRNRARECQNAANLILETKAFVKRHGITRVGFLTLTMPPGATWEGTNLAFERATPYLQRIFGKEWVRVMGISRRGNLHIHVLVVVPFDLQAGFDKEARAEQQALRTKGALTGSELWEMIQLSRCLTTNLQLKALWKELREKMQEFGFASRIVLTPIQTNAEAVGKYLAQNMYASYRDSRRPAKGKVIVYSRKFPRHKAPLRPSQIEFRERRDNLIFAMGMTRETMKDRYGARWHSKLLYKMEEILVPVTAAGEICYRIYAEAMTEALHPYDSWHPWSTEPEPTSVLEDIRKAAAWRKERSLVAAIPQDPLELLDPVERDKRILQRAEEIWQLMYGAA